MSYGTQREWNPDAGEATWENVWDTGSGSFSSRWQLHCLLCGNTSKHDYDIDHSYCPTCNVTHRRRGVTTLSVMARSLTGVTRSTYVKKQEG